ncbi:PEP-CTERM sorting domain-containing protein [Aquabacterium sp. J223]|uniref:PEP-CTERM sorting domain-containing protein n=1 Tax=Aquabacterium sp. J223 TaxID=2898431 RepID=UPI0021ADFCAC|nr:PEP-CTERM sorting domain-containing protein [Aquabacterium sp. J223]UUX94458.1 PEP-CTERM sorting domain-containing protein [Aquabacterium sp. J223]
MKFLSTSAVLGLLAAAPAFAAPILIDFELPSSSSFGSILEYYNGGTDAAGNSGPDLGVSFGGGALALLNDAAGPYFSNAPSAVGVMTPVDADSTLNSDLAFTGLSFYYSSAVRSSDAVEVWSGLNGTGTLLASFNLLANATTGCSDTAFCNFNMLAGTFADARSVVFSAGLEAAFDNITITPIPEPSTYALMVLGLAGLGVAARRNKKG